MLLLTEWMNCVPLVVAALAAAVVILLFSYPAPPVCPIIKRFVLYRPDVSRVDITGSFTNWARKLSALQEPISRPS